jgi:hypothetical protein
MPPKAITGPYINFTPGGTAAGGLGGGGGGGRRPHRGNNGKGHSRGYDRPLAAPVPSANMGLVTFLRRRTFPSCRPIPSY